MFRLQNNIPSNYIDESRDFQLLCRLYDIVNNGVMYDIKSITNLLDANTCLDSILDLLATRKGFFTDKTFNTKLYRALLDGFPYIQKYKGSKLGVEMVVSLILRLDGLLTTSKIIISNNNINIVTEQEISNKLALDTLLKYVLPIGMTYNLSVVKDLETKYNTQMTTSDVVKFRKYLSSATNSNISDLTNANYDAYQPKIITTSITDADKDDEGKYKYTSTSTTITSSGNQTESITKYNSEINGVVKLNEITVTAIAEPNNKYDHSIDSTEIIGSTNYSKTNDTVENYKVENDEINEETNG